MPEPTATNPQTGEKIVFRGGQWMPFDGAPQPGPVYGAPDPGQANENTRTAIAVQGEQRQQAAAGLQNQKTALDIKRGELDLQDAQAKSAKLDTMKSDAVLKLSNVIDKIDTIYGDVLNRTASAPTDPANVGDTSGGFGETGLSGSMLRSVPGTAAFDLAKNVSTIEANAAFDALQKMREASPTGGAVGNVSDTDMALLKSTIASLDPNQSQEQFIRNLATAKAYFLKTLANLDPQAADSYLKKPGARKDAAGNTFFDPTGAAALRAGQGGGGGDNGGGGGVSPFMAGVGGLVEGLGDIVGIAGNPLNAAINAAAGTNLSTDLGKTLRRDILGIPESNHPIIEAVNSGGVAALTGSLGARGAATLANPGVARNALELIGRTPIRDAVAGMGAGAGGAVGKASGVPGAELAGNVIGGIGGYGAASSVNALANAERSGVNALAQAAQRQGVDLLPADAGGPVAKAVTTGAKASPFSVAPIAKTSRRAQDQMAGAVDRAARSQGQSVTTDLAGQNVRNAAERFTKETSQRASRLYDKANEAAQGVTIAPTQTIARLDEYIARVKNDPSAPESAATELQTFRDKIAQGVNVAGLRDARTRLSQGVYDGKLRSGADSAMWKDILNNLSGDIEAGLTQSGRSGAAQMFKRADAYWKDRVEHIDRVLQPILGKDRSGEQIVQSVESMARGQSGGNARLSRLLAQMTPEEAGQTRAVIIDRMGKANPGAQTAEGDAFSPASFLTNWNKMTPQAKASLFADKGLRQNLDDIARLAEGMKASQAMANHSNTGIATISNVGAQAALAVSHPVGMLIAGGGQYLTGRLMASPAFARLLARTAKMPPEMATRTLTQQLGVIAAREPVIANDAQAVQQFLTQGFAQSPTRAAAQGQEEGNGR